MNQFRQFRSTDEKPSIEVENDSVIVSGYAIVFNKLSCDLGGYREMILPSAIDEDIIKNSDIFCYINHGEIKGVLERSRYGEGGLNLTIDDIGLKYSFALGSSPLCQELRHYLDRGIIQKSSFCFTVSGYRWIDNEDGSPFIDEQGLQRLNIIKFDRLFDVSPVFEPAYIDTSANINKYRSKNELFVNECNNRKVIKPIISDDYYKNLRKKYNV